MANKKTLKGYFETGDVPNQSQYHELINSNLNLNETETQSITGSLIVSQSVLLESALTASGNISSSGTITQANGLVAGEGRLYFSEWGGSNIHLSKLSNNLQLENGGLFVNGQITASGNISSSKDLTGTNLNIDGNISIKSVGFLEAGGVSQILFQSGQTYFQNDIKLPSNKELVLGTNSNYKIGADNVNRLLITSGSTISQTTLITYSPSNKTLNFNGDAITTNGYLSATNITASGNISASGNLILDGNITASGNISGSNLIVNKVNIEADSNNSDQAQLDINSTQNSVINIYHDETLTTSFHSRGNINSFIEAGNSIANLGVGTSSPTEKLTVKGNISSSGNIILEGHITASGNINGSGNLQIDGSQVNFTNLPTSDPNIAGRLFRDGTDLKISVG
tara:strand:+ start:149 stop:1342 length:1194 start_codon:yes stop_codon:yes gene_type:complete